MRSSTMRALTSAILLLSLAGGSLAVSGQTTQLRLVSTAWSPFTNGPGQPRFALDLVEAALDRVGIKTSTTIVDASQFTTALLSGKFDGSAAAWKDVEREKTLLFSQPYLENRLILVARRGGDVTATSFAGLEGKRIAIVEGYWVRRSRRSVWTNVRAIEVRGRQPEAPPRQQSRLHAHGRARRPIHRPQLRRGSAHAARDRFDTADPSAAVPCRQPEPCQTRNRSSTSSTLSFAA